MNSPTNKSFPLPLPDFEFPIPLLLGFQIPILFINVNCHSLLLEFGPEMSESGSNDDSLIARVQQLEHERDELRKDIEQLCMQQAGPSYLVVATRMHFQRTAGLEQEIESLKKKLAACTRDNLNLQEELSEVYHIKSQLADLHSAEVSKNMEAEKQVKFFQGCVATAFAERDNALMEAEKAKDREEAVSQKMNDFQRRVEELTSVYLEEKKLRAAAEFDLMKLKEQSENVQKVIDKFYGIRQSCLGVMEDQSLDTKCECLLEDAPEWWSFDDHMETSTSEYIVGLEKEVNTLKNTVDNLQHKLRVGLEIEDHLKKKVFQLEQEKILLHQVIKNRLSELHHCHIMHRLEVMDLLEHEKAQLKSMLDMVYEKTKQLQENRAQNFEPLQRDANIDDVECRDVHITTDADPSVVPEKNVPTSPINFSEATGDTSAALAQALQEKVAALLLLSQQEERHLLERNVSVALQKKMEELQRNLLQVTNEKVKALMEFAQLRQDYQILQENISQGMKQGNCMPDIGDKSISSHEGDGKLRNLLKKTYLRRWIGRQDPDGNEADNPLNYSEGNFTNKKANHPMDFARMTIENATLKESIESMDRLTYSIHRLRLSLSKARESVTSSEPVTHIVGSLNDIITEAKLVKTALGSSLPVSWSAEANPESFGSLFDEPTDDSSTEKLDFVSAAGFEMVELLILAAQLLKETIS